MKKIISCLILCAMLLSLIPLSISAEGTTVTMTEFDTSKGSEYADGTVVTIATAAELEKFNSMVASGAVKLLNIEFRLIDDIDYTGKTWTAMVFKGHFNGNGHSISNLSVTGDKAYAMFRLAGGTFENLTLINVSVTVTSGNGAAILVAARNNMNVADVDLIINNVHIINGNIKGSNQTGGFVGVTGGTYKLDDVDTTVSTKTIITNSSFQGSVSGAGYVGGFVGYADQVDNEEGLYVDNCYFEGTVTGTNTSYDEGYILGTNRRCNSTVQNCAAYSVNTNISSTEMQAVGSVNSKDVTDQTYTTTNCKISNPVVVGYQEKTNNDGSTDYRFVAAVALSEGKTIADYTDIGFYVTLTKNGAASDYSNTKVSCYNVYTSVSGTKEGDTEPTVYKASDFGADYLFVVVFEGVPAENNNFEVTLTPYLTPAEGDALVGAADALKKNQ